MPNPQVGPSFDSSAAFEAAADQYHLGRLIPSLIAGVVGYKPVADPTVATATVTQTGTSSIASAVNIPLDATHGNPGAFRFLNGKAASDANFPFWWSAIGAGYVTSPNGTPPYSVDFAFDGSALEFLAWGKGSAFRIYVDGVERHSALATVAGDPGNVVKASLPPDGNEYIIKLDFGGVRAKRIITLETATNFFWGGLNIGPNDTIWKAPRYKGPRALWAADSYGEGTGANTGIQSFIQSCSQMMGWEGWASASGGTGYLNPGSSGRVTFQSRVQNDVIAQSPDIVLIAGGLNDNSGNNAAYTQTALYTAARLLYSTIAAGLPSATIIVIGPWEPSGSPDAPKQASRLALMSAASDANLPFIDVTGWFTGTGHVGATTGVGNADLYISSDGTHPTQAGHDYLGRRLAASILETVYRR